MSDGITYWQIRHKQDPKRNVWVSGLKGLCDTPEAAMKMAQSCKECLEGDWDIINCQTEENWQNARRGTFEMNASILYLIVGVTVFVAWILGRSLDQKQSNNKATWKTGVVGFKTIQQSVILGLVAGPIVYFIKGGTEELWFCIACMMAAPFIVDMLRPTVTFHHDMPEPTRAAIVTGINKLNFIGVILGIILLGSLIAFSAMSVPDAKPSVVSYK